MSFQSGVDGPVTLSGTTLVKARILDDWGQWSAMSEAAFVVEVPQLHITEINYNPYPPTQEERAAGITDDDDLEFVELLNAAAEPVNLLNVRFSDGIEFTFGDTTLDAGARTLVVKDQAVFEARYGTGHNIAGQFVSGRLNDRGEPLELQDARGNTIVQFSYGDRGDWPDRTDGQGATLELVDVAGDPNDPANWRSSNEYGGSPGTQGTGPIIDVIINEVVAVTDREDRDQIELHNTTDQPIDVSGWYLATVRSRYTLPVRNTIEPGEYRTLSSSEVRKVVDAVQGGDFWLLEPDSVDGRPKRFVDRVHFEGSNPGASYGRWPDGDPLAPLFPQTRHSLGFANLGPVPGEVIVAELHYHPRPVADGEVGGPLVDEDYEFIELVNSSQQSIDLGQWKLEDAVQFSFEAGTVLAPQQALVVVGFDPSDSTMAATFRDRFGIDGTVTLVGPYRGNLRNSGENLQLLRPQTVAALVGGFLLVDQVGYDDAASWPKEADGRGKSLVRLSAELFGNFANSWRAADPSPGSNAFAILGDMNVDGRVDEEDIAALVLGLNSPAGYEEQYGVTANLHGDQDGDGDLDFDDLDEFAALIVADDESSKFIEFDRHVLEFNPTRDDLTVGIASFNVFTPDEDWTVKFTKDNFDAEGVYKYFELYQIGKNRFELPALKIEATKTNRGPVCMSVKIWFNEIPNRTDALFYVKTIDRYSLLTFCTRKDPRARARFSQNRVDTLEDFREILKTPFILNMKQNVVPWRPGIIVDNEGGVYFHSFLVEPTHHTSQIWRLDPDGILKSLPVPDLRRYPTWQERARSLAEDRFGTLTTIAFIEPVAWDMEGNLYAKSLTHESVESPSLYQVVRIDANGESHVVASPNWGHMDGVEGQERYSTINALTVGPDGNIYVADGNLNTGNWIRRIAPDETLTTMAGSNEVGFADGKGDEARFFLPSGLAADQAGNLYVADPVNSRVRKVTPDGVVTTLVLGDGTESFVQPSGVAVGPNGDLYVLDGGQTMARVRKISPDGTFETLVVVD